MIASYRKSGSLNLFSVTKSATGSRINVVTAHAQIVTKVAEDGVALPK